MQEANGLLLGNSEVDFKSISFFKETPFSVMLGSKALDGSSLVLPCDIRVSFHVSSSLSTAQVSVCHLISSFLHTILSPVVSSTLPVLSFVATFSQDISVSSEIPVTLSS